jgi:hypothetical protein
MEYILCTEFPNKMLLLSDQPCLSIYMPTHRIGMGHMHDALVFKNLAKTAKASLVQKYSRREMKKIVKKLTLMETDVELWNHSLEGLAIFATLEDMILYRVESVFEPIAIVSNNFHIKPLIQHFQSQESFSLLALEVNSFELYVGNQVLIHPFIISEHTDTTLSGVLGTQHTENYQTHGTYGGASDGSTFHGHGGKSEEVEVDRGKYFKFVDRFVLENLSNMLKLPLILVARKELQSDFRKNSTNPFLMDETIDGSFSKLGESQVLQEIKQISHNWFMHDVDQVIELFYNQKEKYLSSDQLILVLKALLESRVSTLLIEANIIIPGRIDVATQQMIVQDLDDPQTDDILDDMVQQAYLTGAKVYILEKEKMPTTSGVAGIFRY